jgi:DNA-binding response OmpR family regulator
MMTALAKILLIEDDQFLAKMYFTKLSLANYEVITADNGERGLFKAQTEKPDLILLDIMLPGIDGWEVLQKIKADKTSAMIPVILLTNLGQQEEIERGLHLGASDYLIKAHFTPKEILKKIADILNK